MAKREEIFSMYNKDAKNKYETGVGDNKKLMPKEMFTNKQEDKPKNNSLVADQFGDKKTKNWEGLKKEFGNDPKKMAEWLNNNPGYKAGNLTKKGMDELGYAQGEDGKWSIKQPTVEDTTNTTTKPTTITTTSYTPDTESDTKPTTPTTDTTTEDLKKRLEELTKKDEELQKQLKQFQDKYGNFNEGKTIDAMAQYEQKMVEMGAGKFDKDGKFILKDTTKKGWEDYATMLSAGLSVIGLAMGVPIPPINFRKITNKDEKDAKIREFQKQYTDIMANGAAKVEDVKSSAEAGKFANENEEDIKSYSKYKGDVGAYEAKSTIDTDSQLQLINEQTQADLLKAEALFEQNKVLKDMENAHAKDMAQWQSELATKSAKELYNQQQYKWIIDFVKEAKAAGLENKDIALKVSALGGTTPFSKGLDNAKTFVDMVVNTVGAITGNGNNGGN